MMLWHTSSIGSHAFVGQRVTSVHFGGHAPYMQRQCCWTQMNRTVANGAPENYVHDPMDNENDFEKAFVSRHERTPNAEYIEQNASEWATKRAPPMRRQVLVNRWMGLSMDWLCLIIISCNRRSEHAHRSELCVTPSHNEAQWCT